jgi:hypothetical protein
MHTAGILRELGLKSLFYTYAFGVVPWAWHTWINRFSAVVFHEYVCRSGMDVVVWVFV